MRREAQRTLHSLSTAYQVDVSVSDYEVIAIDNGSTQALSAEEVQRHGPNFRYHYYQTDSVSPVDAVNMGAQFATGEHVAVIVDGARMATPGLIWATMKGSEMFANPFVCALSWHLGPDIQGMSMQHGYNQAEEDRLLDSISWPEDGYRLFDISTIAPSSKKGFLEGVPPECSWFAMPRSMFLDMGGFDERFRSPGGGLVNHDFRNRVLTRPIIAPVVLLGEGVFHQFHGGIATNVRTQDLPPTLALFREEYERIRKKKLRSSKSPPAVFFGKVPLHARRFFTEFK
jgi:glycosyltransferase involved in cell wall biosynthesis